MEERSNMKQSQIKVGSVSDYLYTLMTQTKAKNFVQVFLKKMANIEKVSLIY